MEASLIHSSTIVDLLDRVLDKGLVINADIIISVAGIPLIGVNLRAALAGMETMLEYGMMKDWDEQTRGFERRRREKKKAEAPFPGEVVVMEMRGACRRGQDSQSPWALGRIYLTNRRLILLNPICTKVMFEEALQSITGLSTEVDEESSGAKSDSLCLFLEGGRTARLQGIGASELGKALKEWMVAQKIAGPKMVAGSAGK